jgi:drug/metabolite transporter (DMT)-like permease
LPGGQDSFLFQDTAQIDTFLAFALPLSWIVCGISTLLPVIDRLNFRTTTFSSVALLAFASNSILCRLALAPDLIDAGTFTFVRLFSGAIMLVTLVALRDRRAPRIHVRWGAAFALFVYAMPFSFAYLRIPAGTGALILFGAVQATMIGSHMVEGKRLHTMEVAGLFLALVGLAALTLPGATSPDLPGACLMLVAGAAWGVYSLKGRRIKDPLGATSGNFIIASLFALPFLAGDIHEWSASTRGVMLAVASGTLASGVGYAVWYTALRELPATQAGILQLLVPVLAAVGGVIVLDETVSLRLVVSGTMIFVGVGLASLAPVRDNRRGR